MSDEHTTRSRVYEYILIVLGGATIGWFVWWFGDGYGGGSRFPLWLYEIVGMVLAFGLVRWLRGRGSPSARRKWVHLLWVPVVLWAFLMVAVIIALMRWQ